MKLNFKPQLKPTRIFLHLPGEVEQDLLLLQRYVAEELNQGEREKEELLLTIIQRFFEAGDQQFLAWKRTQRNGAQPKKLAHNAVAFDLTAKAEVK